MANAIQINEPGKAPLPRSADGVARLVTGDTAPLSFAQQQIWLHAQMVPGLPIYNEPVTIQRHGALDVRALGRALTEIVRRHHAWRTAFQLVDGEPVQVIQPVAPVLLPLTDLSHLPPSQREAEARRLANEDALRPFDLSEGPLFRVLLVRLSDNEHRLFFTLHHIIFDGYSIYRVLLGELATLYAAYARGEDSPLTELPVQYPDFAVWEREWLVRDDRLASQLAYWRRQLQDNSPVELSSDRRRPPIQSFRGAIHPLAISKDLSDALKLLSRREGTTLFMTLLAGFAVLLQRYCPQDSVAIGTVSSGRKRSELEGLLGYFLNPVVLRNDLSGNPTFRELLRRTRNVVLDALSNDDAPFTHVVNEVRPSRSLSVTPLFQVLLTLEPPLPDTQDGWTVALTQSEVDTGITKFDLCLELDDRPNGIIGRFKYSTDLFQPETIARMATHLITLMEGVVADPDQPISALPLLTPRERHQVCIEWNETVADFPSRLCLQEMVEEQADRAPEAVALIDGGVELSYRELERRSNQLAAYLVEQGIGPEVAVGLCLEPSWEMIAGILGVLKAGGACVPLDPTYPPERLAHILEDTQLRVLLTQSRLQSLLPPVNGETICLDTGWSRIASGSSDRLPARCKPENLAYVIYTSGSTGKPKGVQVTHRNLVHSTYARRLYYGPEGGRFLLLSSFGFDSSLAGIFGTLARGGSLVLTSGPLQSYLTQLAQIISRHQVSHLLCVPSLYGLLLDQAKSGELSSLQVAIVAGEPCPFELVERHARVLPQARLFNEYGPTEAAVWSTVYECKAEQPGRIVPIGRPIPNARTYVLDPHRNPLPVGVPGELYVGGPGVVRGYLNRGEETGARFVPDTFHPAEGARLYKTGDLVRYLPGGNLEYLRRLDHQVKINGFRIELEEIEAVISEFKGIRQVVVIVRREKKGEPRLVAYLVPAGAQFDADSLRGHLSRRLPEAMIPSAFVTLPGLPLMPNGKVNRAALPTPDQPASSAEFAPPDGVLEEKLAEIWKAVLSKNKIGATDNFFDLGGNSLLVAKLLLRLEQRLEKRLSLADIFQAPTIRQLASMLEGRSVRVQHPAIVPIQPNGSEPPLFWVRGGPLFRPLANRLGGHQPVLGIHLPAPDASRLSVPYKFEEIAEALVSRMREVQPEGPYRIAGLCVNAVIAYEMARQLTLKGQQVALLAMFDGQNPAYYQDFSQESRSELWMKKARFHWDKLLRRGWRAIPDFVWERMEGIGLRLSVMRWRLQHALGMKVSEEHLRELDTIVHPASYVYRPKPYPGRVVFFQSTDWPSGHYWDFAASWNGMIGGGLELHKIAGGHQSMFYEDHVGVLADLLQGCLADAAERPREALPASAAVKTTSRAPRPLFRKASFDDYPQISALESQYGLHPRGFDEWTDFWTQNPAFQTLPDWPIGWVCENEQGEIVGSLSNIPLAYELDGRPLVGATSRSLVMDTRYRPYSLSLLRQFFNQKEVDIFLNTTVNDKVWRLQEKFQAARVPAGVWDRSAFWITDYAGFSASLLARKEMRGPSALSYPVSLGLYLKDTLTGKALRLRRNGKEPEFCAGFDGRFDTFWERIRGASRQRLLGTRSRSVLDWHFRHSLARGRTWVLAVSEGGELAAYGIFCRQDNPEFNLQRLRLVDFQSLPGKIELLKPILRRALERCQAEGVHMLEAIGFAGEKRALLDDLYPHYRDLGSWRYFYRANDARLGEILKDPAAWDPTCFDGDASL